MIVHALATCYINIICAASGLHQEPVLPVGSEFSQSQKESVPGQRPRDKNDMCGLYTYAALWNYIVC